VIVTVSIIGRRRAGRSAHLCSPRRCSFWRCRFVDGGGILRVRYSWWRCCWARRLAEAEVELLRR